MLIVYDATFPTATPDGKVEEFVDNLLLHMPNKVDVCNESVIDEIRLRICRGELNPEDVTFSFEGLYITANRTGDLSEWPKGFCDSTINRLFKLVDCYTDEEEKV